MNTADECCCERKTKHREPEELKALQNRLKRIEGQVRGIEKMLAEDAYCPEVLTQVSAVEAALNAFGKEVLASHIRTCVVRDIRAGKDEVAEELVKTVYRFMK